MTTIGSPFFCAIETASTRNRRAEFMRRDRLRWLATRNLSWASRSILKSGRDVLGGLGIESTQWRPYQMCDEAQPIVVS